MNEDFDISFARLKTLKNSFDYLKIQSSNDERR